MKGDLLLLPNLGAEEGRGWRAALDDPVTARVARLWRLLFGRAARFPEPPPEGDDWPAALGERPEGPVFPWPDAPGAATAWLNDERAARDARAAGRALSGPSPGVVRRVHDKAFALAAARSADLVPDTLRDLLAVLEPEELRDGDRAVRGIEARLARWPRWAARDFTLKPRFSSSGRGRVAGRADRVDSPELRGALPRLADRGGAVLEPWLAREGDSSTQLRIDPEGSVVLLGTLEQITTPAGLYRGHRGTLDHRGRIASGCPWDEELRGAAAAIARAAAEEGYFGVCGVDAFRFRIGSGRPELRPVVELNARFTAGTVVVGLLRRALPTIRARTGLRPGELLCFEFSLAAAAPGSSDEASEAAALVLPLGGPGETDGPVLRIGRRSAER